MSAAKENDEGWEKWIYHPAPIITVTPKQRSEIIKWLTNEKGALKRKALGPNLRAEKLGEFRDVWNIGGEPFFIHQDPVYTKPGRYRIQIGCKPEHAEELLAAGLIKKIPQYK